MWPTFVKLIRQFPDKMLNLDLDSFTFALKLDCLHLVYA